MALALIRLIYRELMTPGDIIKLLRNQRPTLRRYMDGKHTLKEIIAKVMKDIEENGLDILSDRISGNFAWFRGLELAFAIDRLRGVDMIQKRSQADLHSTPISTQ